MIGSRVGAFIIVLSVSVQLIAQRHHFVSYSIRDGLAQSQVRSMLQTSDGFIWIATFGGLSRFDGFSFKNYNKSNGLISNQITDLFEKDDDLWVACKGGLVRINDDSVFQYQFDSAYSNVIIYDIYSFQNDNRIFIATNGQGILVYEDGNIESIKQNDPEKDFVRSLMAVGDTLIIGTANGLFGYVDNKFFPVIENISVSSIHSDSNQLWLTTYDSGVFHGSVKLDQWKNIGIGAGLPSNHTRDLAIDKNGKCWITLKHEVFVYNTIQKSITRLESLNKDLSLNFRCVLHDQEGNIWIGSEGSGILKYTGDDFEVYTTDDGLVSDLIMNVDESVDGTLWYATYGEGVLRYDGEDWRNYGYVDNLNNNTVWSVLSVNKDSIWFGTSEGINILSKKRDKIISFEYNEKLPYPRVSALFQTKDGAIWIGTRSGIARFRNDTLETPGGLNAPEIRDVKSFEEIGNKLYFSSSNGLFRFHQETGTVKNYTELDGLSDRSVNCLTSDNLGNIWMGTDNGVTLLLEGKEQFKSFNVSENFSSNIVNFIHADRENRLWAGTDNGLFMLSLPDYYSNDSVFWEPFGEHQGVTSPECNQNAIFEDSKGNIWFGTNNGLFKLNSRQKLASKTKSIPLYINHIELNYEEIDRVSRLNSENQLAFAANENRMTFYFSAIHFSNPDRIKYSYRLIGSSDEWSPPSDEDHVTFANLTPGSYRFEVRSKLDGGQWSAPISSDELYIRPPFWQTWWFISAMAIVLLGLAYQIHLFRAKQRKRKAMIDELENKAKILGLEQQTLNAHMNRHFIFNALNSIQYYINTKDRRSANTYLTNFAHLVRKNLDSAQVDMIYLKDELDRLRLYLKLEQMRFADRFVYELTVDPEIEQESVKVPSMILQPFVENSIMHGILPSEKKGLIQISIKKEGSNLEFSIKDNGIGITESLKLKQATSQHVSNGMKITRQRMELLKKMSGKEYNVIGPIELKDSLSNDILGTEIRIILPESPVVLSPIVLN